MRHDSGVVRGRRVFYGAHEPVASLAWEPPPDPGTVALEHDHQTRLFRGSRRATLVFFRAPERRRAVEVIVERPAALDVHKAQVTACVRMPAGTEGRAQEVAEFSTTVRGLLTLHDWLGAHHVKQVAMEATGVYWKPVWAVLSGRLRAAARERPPREAGAGPQDRRL